MRFVNFLIKPASSLCNLRCRYCFYADEAAHRTQPSLGVMADGTVDTLLTEAFCTVEPGGAVSFAFQGGEPTVAGLEFFRQFAARAHTLCPKGVKMHFSIQTNGTLLDEEWAEFFRQERFLVGLSLDGFKDLHDRCRVDAEGAGTWNRAARAARLLQSRGVEVNALCVVTGQCARSPEKAYNSLKKLGLRYLQFIACLDPIGVPRGCMPYSLTPEAYGRFLCRMFDLWYADWAAGRYCSVRLFEDYVHVLLGDGASTCAACGQCGAYFVVEADGSVYPCDFFVLDEWRMGRLGETPLSAMAHSERAAAFLQWGREKPAECAACRWHALCNGGCKNDWAAGPDGRPHNYYCKAFDALLTHAAPRLMRIAQAEARARGV